MAFRSKLSVEAITYPPCRQLLYVYMEIVLAVTKCRESQITPGFDSAALKHTSLIVTLSLTVKGILDQANSSRLQSIPIIEHCFLPG